ncbi:hypothetical protein BUALT_Bualt05G0044300 [Buddleja alternifolia]|uniref:Hydrophobic seed protein domain-containing protein n=1 Tax=Buddleja alternifolia TaxID=168488 RepID=A0AAV6XSX9_9LAMI|nr:hypothetical protein BUALT_Bualt05G0044200 [Buddleja alternifolia]KAG8382126.1 hypothetical protein BUALT_Bualt05G0044300 [Buddleja alternifolia]
MAGLVHEVVKAKPSSKCCALMEGLADLEAALCLCTTIKANVLGVVKFKMPIALSTIRRNSAFLQKQHKRSMCTSTHEIVAIDHMAMVYRSRPIV